jgi:hypothetical protein
MPRSNRDHRVEDVKFRQHLVRCTCGWESRGSDIERAWLDHRREYGLTSK